MKFASSLLSPLYKWWGLHLIKLNYPSYKDALRQVWLNWSGEEDLFLISSMYCGFFFIISPRLMLCTKVRRGLVLLCRLPALTEATYRDHYLSSCVVITKNFCHIFLGKHTGQVPDIWHRASVWRTVSCNAVLNLRHVHFLFDRHFEYCGHRQICSQDNFCHIFLGNHTGQLPDIWHRASVWRNVSCNYNCFF